MGVRGGARGGRGGEEGESEGEHEGVGADGDAELPVSQASQEEDDDDPDRVEDDEASATEEEDWEEDNERHFGSIPTGKSTPGLSIKLLCKIPCLPISIL